MVFDPKFSKSTLTLAVSPTHTLGTSTNDIPALLNGAIFSTAPMSGELFLTLPNISVLIPGIEVPRPTNFTFVGVWLVSD